MPRGRPPKSKAAKATVKALDKGTYDEKPSEEKAEKESITIIDEVTTRDIKQMEDQRMVKGTFIYRKKPGGKYTFSIRKYANEDLRPKTFKDTEDYIVPIWLANWLNGDPNENGCVRVSHEQRADSKEGGEISRYDDYGHVIGSTNILTTRKRTPIFQFIIKEYL